ncbi:MAG: efflux RND transporter permease subunit [Myxococcales bacterium]|nr:efflux RND transporter permease subunit [Myxococcales bacterium]
MIDRLVDLSVRRPQVVLVVTMALAIAGAASLRDLELDALPDITGNYVTVLTAAPGLSPGEVELLVTRPVEAALGGMPGLEEQRSLSRYGISSVVSVFEDDVPPFLARQIVQERLSAVQDELPRNAGPPVLGPYTGGLGEVFQFTLRSPRRTQAELFELSELEIAPLLKTVSGVVEVNTWGGAVRTMDVVLDPIRLASFGLTLSDVREALNESLGTVPAATLPRGDLQTFVRSKLYPASPGDLADRIVGKSELSGMIRPVRLGEVATIEDGHLPRLGSATQNGRGETVYVMVQMLRGANALDVIDGIEERFEDVQATLPKDVSIDVVYDRSELVRATVRTVTKNLSEGGLLVIIVLFAMLGSIRAGLLVALSIPLSMLGALSGMVLLGIPGNLMSLGAIDFGLLVDGAVVMAEGFFHSARDERSETRFQDRVKTTARSLARPVFFSVLIILLVYVPILSLTGVDGKMFRPMAITVILALATSILLVLTFVPAASVTFLRAQDVPSQEPALVRLARRLYEPQLRAAVAHPGWIGLFAASLLGSGVLLFFWAGSAFVPQLDEGDLVIQTNRAPDISIEGAVARAQRLESALIERVPEVARVASRIGSPAIATDIMGLEQADVFVNLEDPRRWRDGLTKEALVQEIEGVLEQIDPGAELSFTQPIQMRFNELIGGETTDVAVSIFGPDLKQLRQLAALVSSAIGEQEGAEDVRVLAPPELPIMDVEPVPVAMTQFGLTVEDVAQSVAALRAGVPVGATYEGRLRIPIRLRIASVGQADDLAELPIATPGGGLVRLGQVARVRHDETPSVVSHEDGLRRIVVGFNVRGASLGDVVGRAEASVEAKVALPEGYRMTWGGQVESLNEASARLRVVIPLTVLGIFVVLLMTFGRVKPAFLILCNIPFAGVGGIVALWARGLPVSISAAIGFIALSGIAVLNGVVLMTRVLELESAGTPSDRAMIDAARSRMRPVLMTALVAGLGFVPMMLGHGVGAEVQRPLATVVVGGLATSTLLTLVILPSLYVFLSRSSRARPS